MLSVLESFCGNKELFTFQDIVCLFILAEILSRCHECCLKSTKPLQFRLVVLQQTQLCTLCSQANTLLYWFCGFLFFNVVVVPENSNFFRTF